MQKGPKIGDSVGEYFGVKKRVNISLPMVPKILIPSLTKFTFGEAQQWMLLAADNKSIEAKKNFRQYISSTG